MKAVSEFLRRHGPREPDLCLSLRNLLELPSASAAWRELWQALLVKFVDGRVTVADPTNGVCGCSKQSANFTDAWKAKVIADTADHYLKPEVPNGPVQGSGTHHTKPSRPKLTIRGVAN